MRRKVIRCICSSAIAVWRDAEEPWADVWVRWKTRPGRRCEMYGPTLMARADVEGEIQTAQHALDHPHADDPDWGPLFERIKTEAEARLRRLSTDGQEYDTDPHDPVPNLWTNAPWLTRATAEQLLAAWLADVHGISNPKFEWDHPRWLVRSM